MTDTPSFQDYLEEFAEEVFVGRAAQLRLFEQALQATRPPFLILAVAGQGGVGKTTLLERFQLIAADTGALHATVNEDQPTPLQVMASMADQLRQQQHPCTVFDERYRKYRELKEQVEADPQAPKGMLDFAVRSIARIGLRSLRRIPVAGDAADVLLSDEAEQSIADGTSAFAEYVRQRFTNKDERVLLLETDKELSTHFVAGLNDCAAHQRVILFFDTYEQTGPTLDDWLRDLVAGQFGRFSSQILIVIAGRYPLGQSWTRFRRATRQLELEPFTDDEAGEYLMEAGITDEAEVRHLVELSEHLPILLALLASSPASAPRTYGATVVERFLQGLSSTDREVALIASIPRRFDLDVLCALLGEETAKPAFAWLANAHFVRETEQGWRYHDVVRSLMLRYLRLRSIQEYATLHTRVAEHYKLLPPEAAALLAMPPMAAAVRRGQMEFLYHHLSSQPATNFLAAVETLLEDALTYRFSAQADDEFQAQEVPFSALLGQSAAETDSEELRRWAERIRSLLDALVQNTPQDTDIAFLHTISKLPFASARYRSLALIIAAELQRVLEQHEGALRDIESALEFEQSRGIALLVRARICTAQENYRAALADFVKAIDLQPQDVSYYQWRGRAYLGTQDFAAAVSDFTIAIALQPDNNYNYRLRGRAQLKAKDCRAAVADFTKAIELQPDDGYNYHWRGLAQLETENYPAAVADFTKSIELQPDTGYNYYWRGYIQYLARDYPAAVADFTKAIELQPQNGYNYHWRGRAQLKAKDYPAAIADFTMAVKLQPQKSNHHYWRGQAQLDAEDYPAAVADFTKAIELQPGDGYTYYWCGLAQLRAKDYLAAVANFTKAIELQPDDDSNYSWRGRAQLKAKDYLAAVADFTRAIELQPHDGYNYRQRGQARLDANDYPAAVADFTRAIELQPHDGYNYHWRGYTQYLAEDYPSAIADFTAAIEFQPDDDNNRYWRGRAQLEAKDYPAAIADFTAAIELQPDDDNNYYWRGRAQLEAKDYPAAMADFTRAVELQPNDAYIYFWRGLAHSRAGEWQLSLTDQRAAVRLFSGVSSATAELSNAIDYFVFLAAAGVLEQAAAMLAQINVVETSMADLESQLTRVDRYLRYLPEDESLLALMQELRTTLVRRLASEAPTQEQP